MAKLTFVAVVGAGANEALAAGHKFSITAEQAKQTKDDYRLAEAAGAAATKL
jgi:hypothetical protein